MKKQEAFTLAEVLVTLAIIGIVAAMTIPTLISTYKKHTIETKLKKFYSTMNQAIKLSEVENGDFNTWDAIVGDRIVDKETGIVSYQSNIAVWLEKYILPYLKTIRTVQPENDLDGMILVYFSDGSMVGASSESWIFYPNASDYKRYVQDNGKLDRDNSLCGIKYFTFLFNPAKANSSKANHTYHINRGLEPYAVRWDGTKGKLLNDPALGCMQDVTAERAYCTKLIQINGWKIPDDYFYKF